MAETGYRFATSSLVSTGSWTNLGNIFATDGSEAACSIAAKNTSSVARLLNFGFSTGVLPADATIDQVLMRCVWRVTTAASVIANLGARVYVTSVGLLSTHINSAEITTLTTDTFDITGDTAWAPAHFRDGTLEVRATPYNGNDASDPFYRYDSISLDVFYTPAPVVAAQTIMAICNLDGCGSDGRLPGNALE